MLPMIQEYHLGQLKSTQKQSCGHSYWSLQRVPVDKEMVLRSQSLVMVVLRLLHFPVIPKSNFLIFLVSLKEPLKARVMVGRVIQEASSDLAGIRFTVYATTIARSREGMSQISANTHSELHHLTTPNQPLA